jgi:transcriptional regulator with XRE-family HTH domain
LEDLRNANNCTSWLRLCKVPQDLHYHARMGTQDSARSFGDALHEALAVAKLKQSELAKKLSIDEGQVSRWVHNHSAPSAAHLESIEQLLGEKLVYSASSGPAEYELYIAAPVTALPMSSVESHHDAVRQVVDTLQKHVAPLYWPGRDVRSLDDQWAPNLAARRDLRALCNSKAFLYLQFEDTVAPSSAMVELGIALGRRTKTTIIIGRDVKMPYMFEGFEGVAERLPQMPSAQIHHVASVEAACHLIDLNGRALLGLG